MSEWNEVLKFVWDILQPAILGFLLVIRCFKKISLKERVKSAITLYPEYGLIEQGLLWLSIVIPFCYFIELSFIVLQDNKFSLTADGLKTLVSVNAFPFLVLSLSIPLAGLVSRIHSTEQTAKQIKLVMHKNNLDAFYAHRKELFSYFSQLGETDYEGGIKARYKVHPKIHKIFFKGSSNEGTPEINDIEFQRVETLLISARQYIDGVIKDINPQLTFTLYINVCSDIFRLGEILGLPEITVDLPKNSVHVPYGEINPTTVGITTDELVEAYAYVKNYFLNLCDFASYTPKKELYERFDIGEAGDKYKNIKQPLVIERLHETIIKELIANKTV